MAPTKSKPTFQPPEYLGPYLVQSRQEEETDQVPRPGVTYLDYLGPYLVEQRNGGDTNDVLRRTRANLYQATGSSISRKLTAAELTKQGTPKRPRGRPRKSATPISEQGGEEVEDVDANVSPAPTFSDLGRGMFSVSPEAEDAESIETDVPDGGSEDIDERLGRASAVIASLATSRRQIFDRCMALSQRLRIQLTLRAHEVEVLQQKRAKQEEVNDESRPHDEIADHVEPQNNGWQLLNFRQRSESASALIIGLRNVVIIVVLCYAVYRWFYRFEFAWAERLRREALVEL